MKKTVFLALFLSVVPLLAAEDLRIVPLVRDGHVLISFQLNDGFTDEVRAAIRSGLKTTFTYTIDLRTEVAAWIDRTMASTVVSTSVQYDNLTRRHTVVRTFDGRVQQAQVTESDDQVRQWVTTLDRLPLFRSASLEPHREYYVRVRAEVRPRNVSYLWPWGSGSSAQAKFTFIP
ncbi:MAG: DUF4390 domain-containing protein [Acidobacteria bacterium]|nr:DUF4390 domain-containing protein [Acidobacteriota bacterium]